MISRILFADELACISPEHCTEVCGSAAGCTNVAYPRLVMSVMPPGLRGLIMAVMIAALMSDLDSIFNSASTIFTLDIYKMIRKQVSSRELVIVGRLFVVFMVVISIAWVPVIIEMQGGQMFYYIQEVSDYLTPPVASLFLLGVLWHRCNETGAFWGVMVGFGLGALRLVLAFVYREPPCNQPDSRPSFIKDFHFMYVAAVLFWVSALVTVVVSLCTPPPTKEQIRTTTLWGLNKRKHKQQECEKNGTDITALKPLNQAVLNGNSLLDEEKYQDHPNKLNGIEASRENAQPSNGHTITARNLETHCQIQNGCHSPISDLKMAEEGDGREVRDREEKDESCLGGGLWSGRCMKVLEWFCGLQDDLSKDQVVTSQEQEKITDELLHEPPRSRLILNIGLVLVSSVTVFLFVYFSI